MAINTLVQGFVDLNIKTDENLDWSYENNDVFFMSTPTTVVGGNNITIKLSLQDTSADGIEEIQLGYSGTTTINYISGAENPIYVTWEKGEKIKTFVFSTSSDGVMNFYLKNPKNLNITLGSSRSVNIT